MRENIPYLLSRVAYARDEQAYKSLFLHFHPGLFRFCISIVKSFEAAEEIVSDSLLKLWLMESKLTYVNDVHAYLFKSVKNASLTWLSRQKMTLLEIGTAELNTDVTAETLYVNTETGWEIEKAIANLPHQCQLVFRLVKQEGFSHKQITAILEISQNTIEAHMRTALKRIRLQLQEYLTGKK
ncbi:sigma-70 family RNA polymerase sigma factor [Niabella sp. 22666]|uniref:sigma-70 family RNA polymerase sigma factor n=1 Tax=Niabella sp. 22666 TaxID=3453954 RepID=UPI003F828D7F